MAHTKLKAGSAVRIIGSSAGSAWETGFIVDINEKGALINFGSKDYPVHGAGIRKPLEILEVIK